ncbi:MAG: VWA domain-containing protein [Deltaproteobacteria bacterium]|nr:VWA domain-containing protein [Deltaproteobacteria bacterium]MCW5807100.1 VWA domain-containing protein [Deltaproteobacteria bacterium]
MTAAQADDTCERARVMVILDKSSSMVTGSIGNQTKWDVAKLGLGEVLATYEDRAEFGLMTYPRPNQCGPGGLDVAPAMHNRQAILGALVAPPPTAGNWTPMAQTLDAATNEASLAQGGNAARHVILITDGWQYCVPYNPATRYDGTDAVGRLAAMGITTWIVGFGAEVDAAALNQMAVASGTAKAGCDAQSQDPGAPNNCYYQVDNAAGLVTALTTIAGAVVQDEACDGIDNDCDGQIDEGLTRDCSNACGAGTETCTAGTWHGCTAPAGRPEVCDGEDNDCDGTIDDGNVCDDGNNGNPNNGDTNGSRAGCACSSNGAPDASMLALLAAVGAVVLRRRRRA